MKTICVGEDELYPYFTLEECAPDYENAVSITDEEYAKIEAAMEAFDWAQSRLREMHKEWRAEG